MKRTISLTFEVAGCPTTCMHCWARGGRYHEASLSDIALVLDGVRRFCVANDLGFDATPMHEPAAHTDAARMLKLFFDVNGGIGSLEPFVTTGVPIATRDDWAAILDVARAAGCTTFWTHFHGVGETHDRNMNRAGAFAEACESVRRVKSLGFDHGCNVFVTRDNLSQVDALGETLQGLGMDQTVWIVAGYHPHARMRHYESARPKLDDLLPIAERIASYCSWDGIKSQWQPVNLAQSTEAAYVQKALSGDADVMWQTPREPNVLNLVCRPTLDLHTGAAGVYGERHGNLRSDDFVQVMQRALAAAPVQEEMLYFNATVAPPTAELAERWGDPRGQKIHTYGPGMRARWLDLALAESRKY